MIHVLHALLGSSLAEFKDCKVTAWAPTQNPQAAQDIVAKEMGIPKEDVVCHVTLLSGGFGRKSKPDYVAEAAVLSKKVGRPVKVFWTREDNLKFELLQRCGGHVQESGPGSQREADRLATTVDFSAHSFIFDVNVVYVIPAI